jgi:hypothetical protein
MNDFLLEMLLKDNKLAEKNRGQILEKLDLSSWVEKRGVVSNFFESDLRLLLNLKILNHSISFDLNQSTFC